ncbi:MAG: hypothetical protein IJA36_08495 [Lachnospiraceae bacterium]|nr:hypothetical protein [Lachnospiraceae bacterium]
MNQLVEKYGRVVIICMVSGIVLGVLGIFGTKLYQKSYYAEGGNANDLGEEIKVLGEQGKHPFFVGSNHITIAVDYKGSDGEEGFSREDALSLVEAYEFKQKDGQEVVEKMDKGKIKIYPYDNTQQQIRDFVDVKNTGKYSVRYSVEGESGLKADMTMLVLVDVLPEGMECREGKDS